MSFVLHMIYLACLLGSAITAFVYRKDIRSRQLFPFVPYLALLFIQEVSLYIYLEKYPKASSNFYYNIYAPVNALFFAFFYASIPFNAAVRQLTVVLSIILLAANIVTYWCIQSMHIYNNYLSLAGGLLISLCAILFLFNYFKLDNHKEEKKWLPVVWITIGVVTFYPVVNITFALYKHLLSYQATIFGMKLYRVIPQLMSIFMYSCFTRAFYLCKKKN